MDLTGEEPQKVDEIKINGLTRTNKHVVLREFDDVKKAKTLNEIIGSVANANQSIKNLSIFTSSNVTLVPSKKSGQTNIVIDIHEKTIFPSNGDSGLLSASFGSEFPISKGSMKGNAYIYMNLKNLFGQSENLRLSCSETLFNERASFGVWGKTMDFTWTKPYLFGTSLTQVINVLKQTNEFSSGSFNEEIQGISNTFHTKGGGHTFSMNYFYRNPTPISTLVHSNGRPGVSRSILKDCNPSVKTSLLYRFEKNCQYPLGLPHSGWSISDSVEVAGLFGDVSFVKNEFVGKLNFPLGYLHRQYEKIFGKYLIERDEPTEGVSKVGILSPSLNFGFLSSFVVPYGDSVNKPISLSDRLFLGGPVELRGFRPLSVGPRASEAEGGSDGGDFLGADSKYAAFASFSFPLPIPKLVFAPIKGQVFANSGNLTNLFDKEKKQVDWKNFLIGDCRSSVGVGLLIGLGAIKLELNCCHLLKRQTADVSSSKLQLSLQIA